MKTKSYKAGQCLRTEFLSMMLGKVVLFLGCAAILGGCLSITSPDPVERKNAVWRTDNLAVLAKVALEDKDARVRVAAVEKLKDQEILGNVALNDSSTEVRVAAVTALKDQRILAKIAREAKLPVSQRVMAVDKITEPALLAELLCERTDWDVRTEAFRSLMNRRALSALGNCTNDGPIALAIHINAPQVEWDDMGKAAFAALKTNKQGYAKALQAETLRHKRHLDNNTLQVELKANWEAAFAAARINPGGLANALGAAVLLSSSGYLDDTMLAHPMGMPWCLDKRTAFLTWKACIQRSRIPELRDCLVQFGYKNRFLGLGEAMATEYLNSGIPELSDVASEWASKNGFKIKYVPTGTQIPF